MKHTLPLLILALLMEATPLFSQSSSYQRQQAEERVRQSEREVERLEQEIAILKQQLEAKRTFVLIFLIQGIVFGGFSYFIASQKNRREVAWFASGFFFSLIALIALVAVPKRNEPPPKNLVDILVAVPAFLLVLFLSLKFAEWI